MASLKVYTVFLPVRHTKMLKLFRKTYDNKRKTYEKYFPLNYFDLRWEKAARKYFSKFRGAALRKTYFPGVLHLITTKQERARHFVPPFYRVKEEEDFEKIEQAFKSLDPSKSVHLLEGQFKSSRKLKKRVNLALIELALKGKSILARGDTFFGEMPAITSFSDGTPPVFSEHFKRKKYAPYQDFLVKNYLLDPLIVVKLKKINHQFDGRACPDITLRNPEKFIEMLDEINQQRMDCDHQPLGFLNPILYTNPKIFQRNIEKENYGLPHSVTLWRPNVGLGEPQSDRFKSLFH